MTTSSTTADAEQTPTRSGWRWLAAVASLACLLGATVLTLTQVEVDGPAGAGSRACGSAFDVATDRSGWEVWWARDLDEPQPEVRAELVRTTGCPDAVNTRVVLGAVLGAVGVALLLFAALTGRRTSPDGRDTIAGSRLRVAGRITATVGGVFTLAGVVALVFLLADADSTLFLYTDRLVVALAGMIVLVPAIALTLGGWVIQLVGRRFDQEHDEDG